MKKFICVILVLCFSCFLFSCKKQDTLLPYISELRENVYEGDSENYSLKASYGFREYPYVCDGKVGERVYYLRFKLLNGRENVTYYIDFDYNGENKSAEFKFNPVSSSLIAEVEITDFKEKQFTVNIGATEKESLTLKSILPDDAIDYITALSSLNENAEELINAYRDNDGNFNAEIYERIIVKDGHPYWYIGIGAKDKNLKALLIDGLDGKLLTVREIF